MWLILFGSSKLINDSVNALGLKDGLWSVFRRSVEDRERRTDADFRVLRYRGCGAVCGVCGSELSAPRGYIGDSEFGYGLRIVPEEDVGLICSLRGVVDQYSVWLVYAVLPVRN